MLNPLRNITRTSKSVHACFSYNRQTNRQMDKGTNKQTLAVTWSSFSAEVIKTRITAFVALCKKDWPRTHTFYSVYTYVGLVKLSMASNITSTRQQFILLQFAMLIFLDVKLTKTNVFESCLPVSSSSDQIIYWLSECGFCNIMQSATNVYLRLLHAFIIY